MPSVVFAAPFSSPEFYFYLPAHYNVPALHCVISLLSCNASWNTTGFGVWSWWWGKDILHHHMELLLLCRPFRWLYCRRCSKYVSQSFFSVQYLGVKEASDCTCFLHSCVFAEVTPCSAWVELAISLISKDLFIVVFIPSPMEPIAVHLGFFVISIFLSIHVQQEITISPSLLLTQEDSYRTMVSFVS